MRYDDYIKKISSGDYDDLELGLLSDLEEDAPKELHAAVMNKIKQENKSLRHFEYKKYVPAIAAAVVFIVAIGFSKGLIKQNANINNIAQIKDLSKTAQNMDKSIDNHKDKLQVSNQENNKINNESNKKEKTLSSLSKSASQNKLNDTLDSTKNKYSTNPDGKQNNKSNENQYMVLNDSKTSINQLEEKNNAQQSKDSIDNITKTQSEALDNSQENKLEALIDNQKIRENAIAKEFRYVSSNINYEITLSINQIEIIDFINARGSILSYTIYKLTKEDAAILDQMLSRANVKKDYFSGNSDANYVIVKLNIKSE